MAPTRSRARSAISCRAGAMIRPSLGRRSVLTGRSRMPCTGYWTSPSGKTTAGCAIERGAQSGPGAQDRAQPYWPRPVQHGQCARQAQEGRLERRLHVPTPGRKLAAHGRAGMIFMRRPCLRGQVARDLIKVMLHCLRIGARHDHGRPRAAFGTDRAEQIGRLGAQVVEPRGLVPRRAQRRVRGFSRPSRISS